MGYKRYKKDKSMKNINLEYWTEDEEYEYLGLPPKPHWFKNLTKAWGENRKAGEEKRAAIAKEEKDELYRHIGEPPNDTDAYIKWCDMMGSYLKKRHVGRPKLKPEQRAKPKLKRSEQMKQLLQENGIIVNDDSTLDKYPEWKFLPNGRVRLQQTAVTLSVYQFLKNLNAK